MSAFDFASADGTRIRGWRNDGAGVPVVLSNGLGTPPEAWPAIIRRDSGFRAITWYYRGTGGSARPTDPSRIGITDHVDDLVALMDHEGIDRALIAGWSMGVNIAFEMAQRHPDRVAGLLAVAGVPGGTFHALLGPIPFPKRLRQPLGVAGSKLLSRAGPLIGKLAQTVPMNSKTAFVISHSGLMSPAAKPEVLIPALSEFRNHDFRWYFQLAVAGGEHEPMDLAFVDCPTTLVAGRWDLITGLRHMVNAAARIPHADLRVVNGTHFLPLERPEEMAEALRDLAARTDLQAAAPEARVRVRKPRVKAVRN
jgi:pimeloyl-ACP methyl ester carboxylesterase